MQLSSKSLMSRAQNIRVRLRNSSGLEQVIRGYFDKFEIKSARRLKAAGMLPNGIRM